MGKILLSELQSWYNAVNNIVNISKGSASNNQKDFGSISISSSTTAKASDINALATKLNQFKSDSILGSNSTDQALYGSPGTVSAGSLIQAGTKNSYDTIVTNLAVIKCRNTASNSYGTCENVTKSNENHGNEANGHESYSEGMCDYGECSKGNKSNVANSFNNLSVGYKTNGSYGNSTNSYGQCSQGTKSNGNKSNVTKSNGTNGHGTNGHGTTIDIRNSQSSKTNG